MIFKQQHRILPNPDPYWIHYVPDESQEPTKKISQRPVSSKIDSPFQHGCAVPDTTAPRANAALVVLCRNSELEGVVKSMASMERHFNQWFKYPWVFLNEQEFTDEFKATVRERASGEVEFGRIGAEHWEFPDSVDPVEFQESIDGQGDRGVMYGNVASYHKMCRFYSGFFFKHELVAKRDWYWRVEPDVEFYCDLTYDPFVEMEKHGKKYGFNVIMQEIFYAIPGLFREVKAYIKTRNVQVKNSWGLFTFDSQWTKGEHKDLYDSIPDEAEIESEVVKNMKLKQFLNKKGKNDDDLFNLDPELVYRLFSKPDELPRLHEDRMDREDYSLCHFWTNFEIARTDLFNSKEYQDFFNYLDATGGFYKERWGDAPVHSLAVAMLLDMNEIHYFRDIGYRHTGLIHCPLNAAGKQLPYDGEESVFPDKPHTNGVGCRCKCPTMWYVDREDSNDYCFRKWAEHTDDNYQAFEPIDVDALEKKVWEEINGLKTK
ncbi:putative mannosyltransferase KTR5 [Candida viswanathii]|uniref:Putative mannosyltransferase KTR5 n=1 Tax=Candida viswanathii TaxID=5486 RepID=A0A367YA22_9ASCO|nr:putative mannosyltransferase KTR5 [Candida viswanathii]